jgi:ribonuclease VapC
MVLDSSAVVAIILKEAGYELLVEKAHLSDSVLINAPTAFESAMALSASLGEDDRPMIASLLKRFHAEIVDLSERHYEAALLAFLRFGKGRHPAGLNFGDWFSYAVSALSRFPLLCAGEDFPRTDIQCA